MIALIKNNGTEYHSLVLAIYSNGWKSKVLVFNNDKSKVMFQNYWGGKGNKKRGIYSIILFLIEEILRRSNEYE